jgi:hypothetical protein
MTTARKLTAGQRTVFITATVPMLAAGGVGAWGTYTNIAAEFGRAATALGVVAAGEGVTLVLALVMVLLTMLGQAAPLPVRVGLWLAPVAAAVVGVVVADTLTEAVVYGITPMAMCGSAEGLGLVARRIFVYRTDADIEAQRRNADVMRRIAYQRARAERHPWRWVRRWSALAAWRLMRRAGEGDAVLGVGLIEVQRDRLTEGADLAIGSMLATGSTTPTLTAAAVEPIALEPAHEPSPAREPEPEPEPERPAVEPAAPKVDLTKRPAPTADQPPAEPPVNEAHPGGEPNPERGPEREPDPEPPTDVEQLQIIQLAARLQNGEALTKTTAAPLLGVSVATAGRRLLQARRVIRLAERLKAGDRLTPATAAPLIGVDEKTATLRLTEARQLTEEGTGLYL